MNINYHDIIFPVLGLVKDLQTGRYDIKEVYGTAFSISNGFFITAGHVIKNTVCCEKWGIGYAHDKKYRLNFGIDYELFEELDIAIIRVEYRINSTRNLLWDFEYPYLLTDVITTGFPYALNPEARSILGRSFKGYVSTIVNSWRIKKDILELSFQCPRGLSGAPILNNENKKVIGIVLGNEQSEIEVLREKEIIQTKEDFKTKEKIYIKSELYSYGIALSVNELAQIKSRMLNMNLIDFLKINKLLTES